jgi:hypothetical protein
MMRFLDLLARRFTDPVVIAMWGWVIRQHQPWDVSEDGDGTGPAWCVRCNGAWPCPDLLQAVDHRDQLRALSNGDTS